MFRPIKNFISYFQRNTNDTQNFSTTTISNTDDNVNIENPIKMELNEKDIEENFKINEILSPSPSLPPIPSSSSSSPSQISPQHDQNENEIMKKEKNLNCNENSSNNCLNQNENLVSLTSEKHVDKIKEIDLLNVDDISTKCDPINTNINKDSKNNEPSPICSPAKICDPLNGGDGSPTKVYVKGDEKYLKDVGNTNEFDDIDDINKKFDNEIEVVDEEIIVISPSENCSIMIESGSDPLAIDDDCQIQDNNSSTLMQNDTSSSSLDVTVNDGIICIIDVENIKETTNNVMVKQSTIIKPDIPFDISNVKVEMGTEEHELRSDGSDSGLGLETSTLQNSTAIDSSNFISEPPIHLVKKLIPTKSNLKRRSNEESNILEKKTKRSIHFDGVNVFYFPRMQGFGCVPSQGGCTLGMGTRHIQCRTFSLADYASEQRRVHKQQMQEINPRSSSSDESDSDEEISEASGSDLDADGSGFLQPVPAKQRRALLKAAGIRKIDPSEKDECRAIRTSREFCGCSCRGYCDPDTCSCSQAGIKCQVDRPSFPCGCTRDGCANVVGRVEFNPSRVRTHFIHTIMRLEIENKQRRRDDNNSSSANMPMLNYMNNCIADNSNLSITANLSTCSSGNNSLSNLCNYSSVTNTSHIGAQSYHLHLQQQQQQQQHHNQNFLGNAHYANMMHNNGLSSTMPPSFSQENCLSTQVLHNSSQQQLINSNCMRMMTSGVSHIGNSLDLNPTHSMDLSYPLRDMTTENSMCGNLMIDFSTNSNQIFHHDIYNSQSYISQSYHNQNLNSNNNYHLAAAAAAAAYSNYHQQSYIPYVPQNCSSTTNESIEIHDFTSPDEDSNNYINLHSPAANSSRLDAINDLLHNNRNTPPTVPTLSSSMPDCSDVNSDEIIDPLPMKPTTVSALSESCNLASSGQTSTSIAGSTATKITPPLQTTSGKFNNNTTVVDLTEELIKIENTSPKMSTTITNTMPSNDDIEIIESLAILKDTSNIEPVSNEIDYDDLIVSNITKSDIRRGSGSSSGSDVKILENDELNDDFEDPSSNRNYNDVQIVEISLDIESSKENELTNCIVDPMQDSFIDEIQRSAQIKKLLDKVPNFLPNDSTPQQEKGINNSNINSNSENIENVEEKEEIEYSNLEQKIEQKCESTVDLHNFLDYDDEISNSFINKEKINIIKETDDDENCSILTEDEEIHDDDVDNDEGKAIEYNVLNPIAKCNNKIIENEVFQSTQNMYKDNFTDDQYQHNQQQQHHQNNLEINNQNQNTTAATTTTIKNILPNNVSISNNKSSSTTNVENDENLADIISQNIVEIVSA